MHLIIKKANILHIGLVLCMCLLGLNFLLFSGLTIFLDYEIIKNINRFFCLILLLLLLFLVEKVDKKIIFFLIFLLILYLINLNSLTLNFIYILVFFLNFKFVKIENIIKSIFYIYIFLVATHLFLYNFGLVDNVITSYGGRLRNSYGFENVNKLSAFYYSFLIIILYLIYSTSSFLKKALYVIPLICCFYFIVMSDARTALFCSIIAILLRFFIKFNLISNVFRFSYPYIFSIFMIMSLILASDLGLKYNEILSYRPEFLSQYVDYAFSNPINILFGFNLNDSYPVDNSYVLFIGAIGCILSLVFFTYSPLFISRKGYEINKFPLIFSILVYGLFESFLIRPEFLVSTVFMYLYFFEKGEKRNDFN